MTTFFTSDQHFGHEKIIEYCRRPYRDVQAMNLGMITSWNSVVHKTKDTVWHLGDFTLGDMEDFYNVINMLNGRINIVPGGHDWRWMKEWQNVPPGWKIPGTANAYLYPPLHSLELKRKGERPLPIVLCHYPMASWDRSHYGSLQLYGHVHNTIKDKSRAISSIDVQLPPGQKAGVRINVCVDVWDFYPVPLDILLDIAGISGTLRT